MDVVPWSIATTYLCREDLYAASQSVSRHIRLLSVGFDAAWTSEFNPDRPADLSPAYRDEAWRRLGAEQFDIVVIGGGVVGVGAALDAATRGLRVALVEARDIASGTSSRSSKMFHGGLRYLEHYEFRLVREALRERELSLRLLAPHLVKPLPFLAPLTRRFWERPYMAAGLFLYDRMGGAKSVPGQRHVSRPVRCGWHPASSAAR